MLEAAGQPTDPLEIMLIEQLLMAHHRLGMLHTKAATAATVEAGSLYNSAAVRLMAEFRKTSLALRPIARQRRRSTSRWLGSKTWLREIGRSPTSIGRPLPKPSPQVNTNIELISNQREAITCEPRAMLNAESEAGGSRAAESLPARPVDIAGARAAAAGGIGEPAVGEIHRSENSGRQGTLRSQRPDAAEGQRTAPPNSGPSNRHFVHDEGDGCVPPAGGRWLIIALSLQTREDYS